MNRIHYRKISKSEFFTINEEDLLFITNPGRMGDEDGSTFVIREDNKFIIYRVDGWIYPNNNGEEYKISMEDAKKQFPKWYEAWKHNNDKDYNGVYEYLYMGFGNGLCVNKIIYKEYKPYLDSLVQKFLEKYSKEEKEEMKYAAIFNSWEYALLNMIKDNEYVLK